MSFNFHLNIKKKENMKLLRIKLLVTIVAIVLSTNLSATNPIGNVNTATFVEIEAMNTTAEISTFNKSLLEQQLFSMEEIKLSVQVENDDPNTTATATIMVVSNDGIDEYGPFSISEGEILLVTIDQRVWSVQEIQSSQGAIISSWD